mmetsp:Transcript_7976/g.7469  ORF Transcript_7976/g.7469 Transcript_7976/m.7469 type:complete len:89 (-) Transcript_7976:546-812(-)
MALMKAPYNNSSIQRSEFEGASTKGTGKNSQVLNTEEEEEKIFNSIFIDEGSQGKRKSANRKIKIDQAFKPFLRGLRRCLHSLHKEKT